MSGVAEVWVLVYDAWTGLMVADANVAIISPCGEVLSGKTNTSGIFKVYMSPCPQTSFYVNKTGYRESSTALGVGVGLTEVSMSLIPLSGQPPVDPPVTVNLGVKVTDSVTGLGVPGAQVTVGGVTLITNSYGICVFTDLALALYQFLIQASGYNDQSGTVDTSQLTELRIALTPVSEPPPPPIVETSVTIRVKYEDGVIAEGLAVRLVNRAGGYDLTKITGSTGYVTFSQVPVGLYSVYAGEGAWDVTVTQGMATVNLTIVKPPPPPPDEIPVTWVTNPPIKTGTYKWSLTFQVLPIPFVSDWVAQLMAGTVDDQNRLNQVLANAGVTGTATILEKLVYYKRNFYGAVYEFTIQYTVKLNVTGAASLIAWVAIGAFIIKLIPLLAAIVYGLVILHVLSKVEEIIEGPPSPNLALIVVGALGVAFLSRGK